MLLRQITPLYTQKPTYRLIDDLFFVWDSSRADLDIYMEALNNYRPWLKFTAETSTEKVPSLDTVVYKHQHKLQTTLHIKPTDRQQYLHANSCHPRHTKNSLPYSQALRYRRNISQNTNLDTQVTNLTNAFVNRGYKKFAIQTQIRKALKIPRITTLTYKHKSKNMDRIPFVLPFYPTKLPN